MTAAIQIGEALDVPPDLHALAETERLTPVADLGKYAAEKARMAEEARAAAIAAELKIWQDMPRVESVPTPPQPGRLGISTATADYWRLYDDRKDAHTVRIRDEARDSDLYGYTKQFYGGRTPW